MDLAEFGRVIRRRWYVLLPLLLIVTGMTVAVRDKIAVQYQSTSTVSLLASQQSTVGTTTLPGTGNPFLSFDSSLNDTADFLARRVSSASASNQLAAEGLTGSYSAVLAASQGPFITLTVDAPTAAATTHQMNILISFTAVQLTALQQQEGVTAANMIRSAVIVPGSEPAAQNKSRNQDTIGVGVAGIAIVFLAVFAYDALTASRRRSRKRAGRVARPAAAAGPAPAEPIAPSIGGGAESEGEETVESTAFGELAELLRAENSAFTRLRDAGD
jgi:hypothetical protein